MSLRLVLSCGLIVALTGCGAGARGGLPTGSGSVLPDATGGTRVASMTNAAAPAFSILYDFAAGTDAQYPSTGLTPYLGSLYGTSEYGGANGTGAVFSISPGGVESVVHSFGGSGDGYMPSTGLLSVYNGDIYGSTVFGGCVTGAKACPVGVTYALNKAGQERILHRFYLHPALADGRQPMGLIEYNGLLYGLTSSGGVFNNNANQGLGTAFEIDAGGTENKLHDFGAPGDGYEPAGTLTPVNGLFYGATTRGGLYDAGTMFSMTASGTETVLYSFGAPGDAALPNGDITLYNGTLYGTSTSGGKYNYGAFFRINVDGTNEQVLHSFSGRADGLGPTHGLLMHNGHFFGTTYTSDLYNGDGVLYKMSLTGQETVLHTFQGPDGLNPNGDLIWFNGQIYGSTHESTNGYGEVYWLRPDPRP